MKAEIRLELNNHQDWLDREHSAKSFGGPGKRGAFVYQFNLVDEVDKSTGEETRKWERIKLSRAEALDLWESVDHRELW